MDSTINMHLAGTRLHDALRDAETARAARAVGRPRRWRLHAGLATAGQRKRQALTPPSGLSSGAITHHSC
jgi:hypothetical protein